MAELFAVGAERGVQRMVASHPNFISDMTIAQGVALAERGVFMEHEVGMYLPDDHQHFGIEVLLEWIEAVGVEHTVLARVDGHTYGIPFVLSTPVLFYNATLFRDAGLDPDDPPATWDEVQAAALRIAETTGKDGVYVDCVTEAAKDWCLQSVVRSGGGRVLSADRTRLEFADPPAVEAGTVLQDLVTSGAAPKLTQMQAVEAFARGDLGMLLESSSVQGTFAKGARGGGWELRGTGTPAFPGRPVVPTNSGAALFVLSDDPAKQRAAWTLIRFLTSDEAYTLISGRIGYLPLRTGLVDDPAGLQEWAEQNPLVRTNLAQMQVMEPWVSFPGDSYVQVRDGMMQAVEQVVLQGADPRATLSEAASRLAPLLPGQR